MSNECRRGARDAGDGTPSIQDRRASDRSTGHRPERCISQETVRTADYDEVAEAAGRADITPDTVAAVLQALARLECDRHPWRDPDTLIRLYYDEELTQAEIADELGCKQKAVSRWMRRYDIAPGRGQPAAIRARPNRSGDSD